MNVAVFFGGKSSEHDISIITAIQAMRALDNKHTCLPVYVAGDGRWLFGKHFSVMQTFCGARTGKEVCMRPCDSGLYSLRGKKLADIDCALLCMHGMGGEDGTIAGVLELSGVAYTGSGLRASAVGMDKITLKNVLCGLEIPTTKYLGIDKYDYATRLMDITETLRSDFAFPLIVKPSNLGSSIGISLARDFSELITALSIAFEWDTRVIIEEALEDFVELNCAVLGYGAEFLVSEVEKPLGWKDFLTFEDKYQGGFKGTSTREFPAKINEDLRRQVRDLALKTFKAVDASGVARIDFLLKDQSLYVNEINTIPGSLANYLFAPLTFTQLIETLLNQAIQARIDKDKLTRTYVPQKIISSAGKAGR